MRLTQRILAWFAALDPARRTRLVAAVLIAVATAVGMSMWASRERYAPVVSGRGYDAALTAAAAVDRAGIGYRIAAPDTLEVPVDALGAARAAIAAETDLPAMAAVGEMQLGLTPQAQQWAFLRAAEGELARMLNGIDGIVASKVHVVPRQDALYIGEERPASASVFVKLAPGQRLEQGKVRAIVNLVANAVDGLSPDRVSVADDRGNLLATGDGGSESDGALGAMRSLAEYRTQLETRYERAVSQSLLPVLGWGGGFSATATLDLDLETRETTTRQMETAKQAVVSEVNEEQASTQAGQGGGVPGVDANLPERGGAAGGGGGGGASNRTTSTLNYAYPTVDEVAKRPAGGVRRVSVAVQVDDARIAQLVTASNGALDADTLRKQIDGAIRAAVGYDESRKDQVTVTYLPFAAAEFVEGTESPTSTTSLVMDLVPYVVGALALGLVFWFVVRPLMGAVTRADADAAGRLEVEPLPALRGPGPGGTETSADLAQRLKALVDTFQPVDQNELNRLVAGEAESAADVLRKWTRKSS